MSDLSSSTITIEAPLAEVCAALFTIEDYPTWSTSIKSSEVVERDDQGRALKAKLSIDAGMMKDRVILDYDWSQAPAQLSFSLDDADLLTTMDGTYIVKAIDEDSTQVTYQLSVSLSMPIPAMMRQKAEKATIDQALSQLKSSLES